MDRLGVLCFGGTYALALLCDLARFAVRWRGRWWATLGLTGLAWVVQTAYLGNLTVRTGHLPVLNAFESMIVLSWVLAGVGLYLIARAPRPLAVGMFVLPLVLGLITVAGFWAPREDWVRAGWGGATVFWGTAHGVLYLVGAVGACVGAASGLMYLAQSHRLKHKRPPRFGFALPSLEQSERVNRAAITVAFAFLTAGLVAGLALEVTAERLGMPRIGWADPKVVGALAVWGLFAILLHARFRPEMRGRRVMLLTLVACASLALATVGVDLLHISTHGARRAKDPAGATHAPRADGRPAAVVAGRGA